MIMKRKNFNGLKYYMVFDSYKKKNAKEEADNYRKAGYGARVITFKQVGSKAIYEVYVSAKKFKTKRR